MIRIELDVVCHIGLTGRQHALYHRVPPALDPYAVPFVHPGPHISERFRDLCETDEYVEFRQNARIFHQPFQFGQDGR